MSAPFDPLQMLSAIQGLRAQNLAEERRRQQAQRAAFNTGLRILEANPDVDLTAVLPALGADVPTSSVRGLQEIQKGLKKRIKEKQSTPTAGQENQLASGLSARRDVSQQRLGNAGSSFPLVTGPESTSFQPLNDLIAATRRIEESGIPEPSQKRIKRLGAAQASEQRGERREERTEQIRDLETFQLKEQFKTQQGLEEFRLKERFKTAQGRTEFERLRNRLASGEGTPTQQALDEIRMQKLLKGDQLTGRLRLPDGTSIEFGESALRASRKEDLTDRFVRQKGTLQDLDKAIGLIEEQASRAGLIGKARRASGTALGLMRELASSPFGSAFAQSMNQRAQQLVANGEADESLLRKFEDAQAAGALESLEVAISLEIADALREGNRFSTKLFEEIRKTVDIDSSTTAARVLARLRDQRERIRRKQETTRRLLEGKGASITEEGPEGVRLTPEEESLVEEALGRGGG